MDKSANPNPKPLLLFVAIVVCFGLASFILCILAEFTKTKADEVKFDGRRCSLPKSEAFRFGISSLICLSTAQIFGNLIGCGLVCSSAKAGYGRNKSPVVFSGVLLTISWMSYGFAAIIISTASSINKSQPYGEGWIKGDCYVVKNGVFAGAGALVLVTLTCILLTYKLTTKRTFTAPSKTKPQTQQR